MIFRLIFGFFRVAKPRFIKLRRNFIKRNAGFTLIELSMVLFLVGLLFFTAMPRLGNFLFQTDLKTAARSLKATVLYLRSKSIATHKNTILFFDLDKRIFWGDYASEERGFEAAPGTSPLIKPRRLPEGIRFLDGYNINSSTKEFGRLASVFNPKGVFEETVIHLADSRNRVLTVVINAYTCRLNLYDDYVDVEYLRE